ncbi:MAG: hopanoid biosynthesis-associated RND transporter HpnN [Alphaproteobacteria bacterium]|nr:hopanoid biosynthesis-associated RND transporter HpnN [Alphaproteobacteria bacterium]
MFGAVSATVAGCCRRHAVWTALAAATLTVALSVYVARNVAINTDTEALISSETDWRQREIALAKAFPTHSDTTVVVIDSDTPDKADDAAAVLAARLAENPALFKTVRRPDGGPFFDRYGLLFLEPDELRAIADQLIEAQPLIATLHGDPSLRGLFGTLNLALTGVAEDAISLDAMAKPMAAIAESIEATARGERRMLSWQTLLTGREPAPFERKRFIIVQGAIDYGELQAGANASAAIRAAAVELGLTPERGVRVRLTGNIPLGDEEFVTVSEGMGVATALSLGLVTLLLFLALKSWRMILCVLATLVAGLVTTAAFATAVIGPFNLISVAFAVLFVGIGVDFGIQYATRYRDERHRRDDLAVSIEASARTIGPSLATAAIATALGFCVFLPTEYVGVSELGAIAGAGMLIALAFNLTLMPALLALVRPGGEPEPVGYAWAAPADAFLLRHRRRVLLATVAAGLAGAACLPWLRFDFNPLNLKDPNVESTATVLELMADPMTTPFTIEALLPSLDEARAVAAKLVALPEVERAVTLASFIPDDQDRKLPIIEDLNMLLSTTFALPPVGAKPSSKESLAEIEECARRLAELPAERRGPEGERLMAALQTFLALPSPPVDALADALLDGLDRRLGALQTALGAGPVTLKTLPAELTADWVSADGRARVEITPKGDSRDNENLRRFAEAVRAVTPEISGSALTFQESSKTVLSSFRLAGAAALGSIALLLLLFLRRPRDVALVLTPLAFAAAMIGATMVVFGIPLNFANIIALPLLLGTGVAFNIYFVMAWRAGRPNPLQSSLARAVLFSGATTAAAFGALATSSHPGTASMGLLLTVMLGWALFSTLFVLPALLGSPPEDASAR